MVSYHGFTGDDGSRPDGSQISGQYLGPSETFAGLPSGGDASEGDYAILTKADGTHQPGRYRYDGSVFVFEFALGGAGGFIIRRDPSMLFIGDFSDGPIEAVFTTITSDQTLAVEAGAAEGARLRLVSEGLYRLIVTGDISFEISGAGSVDFEKTATGWVPFNPQQSIPKI